MSKIPADQITKSPYWHAQRRPARRLGHGPVQDQRPTRPASSWSSAAYDEYWRGKPLLDKIIRKEFKDPATALLAFDAGEVDFTYLTADEVDREQGNTNARDHRGPVPGRQRRRLQPAGQPGVRQQGQFRQAMEYAIDRQTIIKNLYNGGGTALSCLFGNPDYTALETSMYDYNPTRPSS